MPKLLLPVPDTDRTVTRPVITSVVRDLIDLTHLPVGTKVYFPGEIGTVQQPGSAMQSDRSNDFGALENVTIEFTETMVEQEAGMNAVAEPSNQFLFDDVSLGVYMRPNYTFSEARLTVRYRAVDRVAAKRWRDEIRNRVLMGRESFVHDVQYSYRIPEVFHRIFTELHRLRENKHGDGSDYKTWFEGHANPRLTIATNQSGTYDEYVIAETLRRVQGWFDFTLEPEQGQFGDNKRNWEISFDYVFQYDRVSTLTLGYPVVVHNQLLSAKYRDRESKFEEQNHTERLSLALSGFRYFETTDTSWKYQLGNGISIPGFDDFIPTSTISATRRIFTALVCVPETQGNNHVAAPGTKLLNLAELGRYKLSDHVLEFIRKEAAFITRPFSSILTLSLYRNRHLAQSTPAPSLEISSDLTVRSTIALDLRQAHRIRLGVVSDLILLEKDALDRLRENACALKLIFGAIYPNLDLSHLTPIGGECGYVPKDQLDDIIDKLIRRDRTQDRWFDTVSTMFVQTN